MTREDEPPAIAATPEDLAERYRQIQSTRRAAPARAEVVEAVQVAEVIPASRLVRHRSRSARRLGDRARVIITSRGRVLTAPEDVGAPPKVPRPRTRGECADGPRPCPWVSCRHHLYLDVKPASGAVTINHPSVQAHELNPSCALDVADLGGLTLDEVGDVLNVTRERVRQIEVAGLRTLRHHQALSAIRDDVGDAPQPTKAERARRAVQLSPDSTDREIAARVGLSLSLVARARKDAGIPPSRRRRPPAKGTP